MTTRDIRTTCPRDCYDACGALVRVDDGGRVVHVRGDPDHPVSRGKLCRKCTLAYNGVYLDPASRLTSPLVRRGPKGSAEFEAVSWERALQIVGARIQAVRDDDPSRIVYSHYTGSFALLSYFYPMRLMRALGATEVAPDTICNDAGHTALNYVYGTSVDGFDPRTARDASCILVWGANPSASAPHQDEHWLAEHPCPVIVVDPVRTATAERAELHLQPFPGSDAALAFGLMHVLHRDGLVDRAFLAEHAVGGEALLAACEPCDPAWTAARTGVPAAAVEHAARMYGAGPALLWIGQGLQRQPRGGNVVRAVAALPAVTGNLGRPGSGFLYLNGSGNRGIDEEYLSGSLSYPDAPDPISHMELASVMESERAAAFVCWNVNPLASCPEQARLRRALMREDLFTVVVDLFATDTADLADVVLPAASWLECDDIVVPYFDRAIAAQVKAAKPLGDSLPNSEIFRRIARAMGLTASALVERDEPILERIVARSAAAAAGVGSFAELAARGAVWTPPGEPEIQFADLRFPTPSGRIELASAAADADGHGLLPTPTTDERPADGRLRLLSPASPWSINASFCNDAKVARLAGPLALSVTASDARALGLREGAMAHVCSEAGELVAPVRLTDALPAGVAMIPKGHWPKLTPGGANVNALTRAVASDMGASTAIHGLEVTVSPVP